MAQATMKLPGPQAGASRQGNIIFYIVLLGPAYKAGLAGHFPVKLWSKAQPSHPF